MIIKTYNEVANPAVGAIKLVYHFAWIPTRINDKLIWLQKWREVFTFRLISEKEWGKVYGPWPYNPDGIYGWMPQKQEIYSIDYGL